MPASSSGSGSREDDQARTTQDRAGCEKVRVCVESIPNQAGRGTPCRLDEFPTKPWRPRAPDLRDSGEACQALLQMFDSPRARPPPLRAAVSEHARRQYSFSPTQLVAAWYRAGDCRTQPRVLSCEWKKTRETSKTQGWGPWHHAASGDINEGGALPTWVGPSRAPCRHKCILPSPGVGGSPVFHFSSLLPTDHPV